MSTWISSENQADSTVIAPFVPALSLVSSETAFQKLPTLWRPKDPVILIIAPSPISMVKVHHITPNLIVQSSTEILQPLLNLHEAPGDLVTGQCNECRRGAHLSNGPQHCMYLSIEVNRKLQLEETPSECWFSINWRSESMPGHIAAYLEGTWRRPGPRTSLVLMWPAGTTTITASTPRFPVVTIHCRNGTKFRIDNYSGAWDSQQSSTCNVNRRIQWTCKQVLYSVKFTSTSASVAKLHVPNCPGPVQSQESRNASKDVQCTCLLLPDKSQNQEAVNITLTRLQFRFSEPAPTAIFTNTAEILHNLPLKWIAWCFFKTWQSTVAVWQVNRNQLLRNLSRRFATTISCHEIRSMSSKLVQCMTTTNKNILKSKTETSADSPQSLSSHRRHRVS